MILITCHRYEVNVDGFVKGIGWQLEKKTKQLTTRTNKKKKIKGEKGISFENSEIFFYCAYSLLFISIILEKKRPNSKHLTTCSICELLELLKLLDKKQRIVFFFSFQMDYNSICFASYITYSCEQRKPHAHTVNTCKQQSAHRFSYTMDKYVHTGYILHICEHRVRIQHSHHSQSVNKI